jgi:hypothetical protein
MNTRLKKLFATSAALGALAVGGAAIAGAQQPASTTPPVNQSAPSVEKVGGPDGDTIQSGDQTTPDNVAGTAQAAGSQAPEQAGSESASEQAGTETASANDGPGGHADEAEGNANADHQFQGTE